MRRIRSQKRYGVTCDTLLIGVSVPQGQFSDECRVAMIADVTSAIPDSEGGRFERDPGRVWVFPIEVPDGRWVGAGSRLHDITRSVSNEAKKGHAYAERTLGSRERSA